MAACARLWGFFVSKIPSFFSPQNCKFKLWKGFALSILLSFNIITYPKLAIADEDVSLEYQLKAVCLYNFAKYVTWPVESFATPEDPIKICILEPSPFGKIFEALAQKTAQNRSVITKIINPAELKEAESCHIFYYSSVDNQINQKIKKALKTFGILTVTEGEGEGTIVFVMQDGKVRFNIDIGKAKLAGLTINSQVLKLALSVIGDG